MADCECGDKIGFHDLQRQLQQAQVELRQAQTAHLRSLDDLHEAQEERDRAHRAVESLRQSLTQLQPGFEECKAERDAAIERAEQLERQIEALRGKIEVAE